MTAPRCSHFHPGHETSATATGDDVSCPRRAEETRVEIRPPSSSLQLRWERGRVVQAPKPGSSREKVDGPEEPAQQVLRGAGGSAERQAETSDL